MIVRPTNHPARASDVVMLSADDGETFVAAAPLPKRAAVQSLCLDLG